MKREISFAEAFDSSNRVPGKFVLYSVVPSVVVVASVVVVVVVVVVVQDL